VRFDACVDAARAHGMEKLHNTPISPCKYAQAVVVERSFIFLARRLATAAGERGTAALASCC